MATPTGFEPVTPRLGIWCSILLSYGVSPTTRVPISARPRISLIMGFVGLRNHNRKGGRRAGTAASMELSR